MITAETKADKFIIKRGEEKARDRDFGSSPKYSTDM